MISENAPKTTYRDIEIVYDEDRDRWLYTFRGKDRTAETLANAKKIIDAPPPKEDKGFRRFEAWYRGSPYGGGYRPATVTSMSESTGRFWVTYIEKRNNREFKERTQTGAHDLFVRDEHNDAIVAQLAAKEEEIAKLREEFEKIRNKLRSVEPKDWEEVPASV